eukprot:Gb_31979 [translate_table: standard]
MGSLCWSGGYALDVRNGMAFTFGECNRFQWECARSRSFYKAIPTMFHAWPFQKMDTALQSNRRLQALGSQTGDILQVSLRPKTLLHSEPKEKIRKEVLWCSTTPNGNILAGGGDENIVLVQSGTLKIICGTKIEGVITSIATGEVMKEEQRPSLFLSQAYHEEVLTSQEEESNKHEDERGKENGLEDYDHEIGEESKKEIVVAIVRGRIKLLKKKPCRDHGLDATRRGRIVEEETTGWRLQEAEFYLRK